MISDDNTIAPAPSSACPNCGMTGGAHAPHCRVFHQPAVDFPKGWICPACGSGNAPWTATCPCRTNWWWPL